MTALRFSTDQIATLMAGDDDTGWNFFGGCSQKSSRKTTNTYGCHTTSYTEERLKRGGSDERFDRTAVLLHGRLHLVSVCLFNLHRAPFLWLRGWSRSSVRQWMIDDSGKPSFDKEWVVRGREESKITSSDLQGLENSDLKLLSHVYTLCRDRQAQPAGAYFVLSQQLKEQHQTVCFVLAQVFTFISRLHCTSQPWMMKLEG